jgi:hypothetical protein
MPDIFDIPVLPEMPFLEELAEEFIRERCEDCLEEHLMGGEPDQDYVDAFQEFYERS